MSNRFGFARTKIKFFFLIVDFPRITYLLTLAPFVNLTVDTFPVSGDSLQFAFYCFTAIIK